MMKINTCGSQTLLTCKQSNFLNSLLYVWWCLSCVW